MKNEMKQENIYIWINLPSGPCNNSGSPRVAPPPSPLGSTAIEQLYHDVQLAIWLVPNSPTKEVNKKHHLEQGHTHYQQLEKGKNKALKIQMFAP